MNKKINLLIFAKSIDGGTGTYVLQLFGLEKLINKLRIKVISLEEPSFRKIDKYSERFVFYHGKNFYPRIYKFSLINILNFIKELFWVKNQINKYNPDLVLSCDVHCNLLISINKFLFRHRNKLILTTHINLKDNIETRSDSTLKKIFYKLIPFFYNKANCLVFVSKHLAYNCHVFFNLNVKLIKTIYNGINRNYASIKKRSNKNIIITIARLVEQKDHETLIKAFVLLKKRIVDAKLLILSNGLDKNKLEKIVKKYNGSKSIRFLGWVKDIYDYINRSDIFVFSSKREGFGYVLLEAMSQGLPVISTNTPFGPSEILDNGKYGILVPMKDPQAMAKAMFKLLTDEKKYNYYAQKSRERVKYFSLDKMLNAYKRVILDLMDNQ